VFCIGLRTVISSRGQKPTRAISCVLPWSAGHPSAHAADLRPWPGRTRRPADRSQVGEEVSAQTTAVYRHTMARQGPPPSTSTNQPLTVTSPPPGLSSSPEFRKYLALFALLMLRLTDCYWRTRTHYAYL